MSCCCVEDIELSILKSIYIDELRTDEGHQLNISCVTDRRFIDSPGTVVLCQSINQSARDTFRLKQETQHFPETVLRDTQR